MKSISRQWISEGYLASLIKKDNLISKKKAKIITVFAIFGAVKKTKT